MNKTILKDHGIEILRRDGHLFARYDSGELVVQMVEVELTEHEAERAQKSARDAYEVLLEAERRGAKRTLLKEE